MATYFMTRTAQHWPENPPRSLKAAITRIKTKAQYQFCNSYYLMHWARYNADASIKDDLAAARKRVYKPHSALQTAWRMQLRWALWRRGLHSEATEIEKISKVLSEKLYNNYKGKVGKK
jgi:hypothetical protein